MSRFGLTPLGPSVQGVTFLELVCDFEAATGLFCSPRDLSLLTLRKRSIILAALIRIIDSVCEWHVFHVSEGK